MSYINNLYFIPGWGFKAKIIRQFYINNHNLLELDYFNLSNLSMSNITQILAKQIKPSSYIIGWSLGGLFAIKIAYLYPEKVKKLILISSQPKLSEDTNWQGIKQQQFNQIRIQLSKNISTFHRKFLHLVNHPNRDPNTLQHLNINHCIFNKKSCLTLLDLAQRIDLRQDYKLINSKILHLIAEKDAIIKQRGEHLMDLNPMTAIKSFKQATHAEFIKTTNQYQIIIENFINE
ncbi:MAG: alpha/beta fold hydrolase [Legionellales bacterium]|nr:alpha/beta fold hydrolase [Legionellales bacterium]